jgi:uncharacterized protein YkwD
LRLRLPVLASLLGLLVAAPVAAADCPSADVAATAVNAVEVRAAVVCLTNVERAAAGLPALAAEGRLEAGAQLYAQRMVAEGFFAHVAPDGSTLDGRLAAYTGWRTLGENLAWGEGALGTPRGTVAAWMASPGHRANILSAAYAEVGVGVTPGAPQASSGSAATWVANYGARFAGNGVADGQEQPAQPVAAPRPAATPRTSPVARRPVAPRAAVRRPVAKRPSAVRKPVLRCARGSVRRVKRLRGHRVTRCVRVVRR